MILSSPPPQLAHGTPGWTAVGVALVLPWAWLVAIDLLLRRKR
jgi:hypothetical protein